VRLNISTKIALGFGILLFLLVVNYLIVGKQQDTIRQNLNTLTQIEIPLRRQTAEMKFNLYEVGSKMNLYIQNADPGIKKQIDLNVLAFESAHKKAIELTNSERQKEKLENIKTLFASFRELGTTIITLKNDQKQKVDSLLEIEKIIDTTLTQVEPNAEPKTQLLGNGLPLKVEAPTSAQLISSFRDIHTVVETYIKTGDEQSKSDYQKKLDKFDGEFKGYEPSFLALRGEVAHKSFKETLKKFLEHITQIFELEKKKQESLRTFTDTIKNMDQKFGSQLEQVWSKDVRDAKSGVELALQHSTLFSRIGIVSSMFIGTLLSLLIMFGIGRSLRKVTRCAEKIIHGNLEERVEISSNDEMGVLAKAFNSVTDNLVRSKKDTEDRLAAVEKSFRDISKKYEEKIKALEAKLTEKA
jgi:methyl-accepting chemotaxis protein